MGAPAAFWVEARLREEEAGGRPRRRAVGVEEQEEEKKALAAQAVVVAERHEQARAKEKAKVEARALEAERGRAWQATMEAEGLWPAVGFEQLSRPAPQQGRSLFGGGRPP